jgi:hypothetical protein
MHRRVFISYGRIWLSSGVEFGALKEEDVFKSFLEREGFWLCFVFDPYIEDFQSINTTTTANVFRFDEK